MKVSKEVEEKALKFLKEKRVKKDIETERRVHFIVRGETNTYSVIYDKQKNEWSCTCAFYTLKEKHCSHILACTLKMGKTANKV